MQEENYYQLLTTLMDSSSQFIIFFNSEGVILETNTITKQFFTITTELCTLSLGNILSVLKLDFFDSEPVDAMIKKLSQEKIKITYTQKNEQITISWSLIQSKNQKDNLAVFLLLGTNITEIINLSSSVEKLDNIIRYAPDMIYWKDKNSIYLGCNDLFAFEANYKDRRNVIGKSDFDLPWHTQAKKFQLDDREVIQKGIPKLNIEDILPISNTETRVVISNKVPLRDLNDEIIGVLGIATDITERKKIEDELQNSKTTQEELERLNNIIRYAPDFIYWKDKNSIHLGCNDRFAHTVGYRNREDIIGKSDFDFPWSVSNSVSGFSCVLP